MLGCDIEALALLMQSLNVVIHLQVTLMSWYFYLRATIPWTQYHIKEDFYDLNVYKYESNTIEAFLHAKNTK